MQRNLKLIIEYDGTRYSGWQRQKNAASIQAVIEQAIEKIISQKVRLIGSGRTDAGVHALAQVANFKTVSTIECLQLKRGLNSILPEDIIINHVQDVPLSFNARYHARRRWYRYQIINRDSPPGLYRQFFTYVPYQLDINKIEAVAQLLQGEHDFAAFRSQACNARRTRLNLEVLKIDKQGDQIVIDFKCRSFLHNMVRIIVGAMIEIGRGKHSLSTIEEMLNTGIRNPQIPTAPPQGLILMQVEYKD